MSKSASRFAGYSLFGFSQVSAAWGSSEAAITYYTKGGYYTEGGGWADIASQCNSHTFARFSSECHGGVPPNWRRAAADHCYNWEREESDSKLASIASQAMGDSVDCTVCSVTSKTNKSLLSSMKGPTT